MKVLNALVVPVTDLFYKDGAGAGGREPARLVQAPPVAMNPINSFIRMCRVLFSTWTRIGQEVLAFLKES